MKPGDFILVHGKGFAPRMIQFGESLRFSKSCSYWNHAAIYIGNDTFIEAKGGHRARYTRLQDYSNEEVKIVSVPCEDDAMRENAVIFAKSQLGKGYGYVTILSLILWCLFGGKLTIGISGTDICSGLVARATERMGFIYDRDPETVMPADLASYFSKPVPQSKFLSQSRS